MRVVVDTNVIISALLKPGSKPSRILRLILQKDLAIVINDYILAEYTEVASRTIFQLDKNKVQIVLEYLGSIAIRAPSLPIRPSLPDPGDEPFLEAALSTKADFLITGNKKHYPARSCKKVTVVTHSEFLQQLSSDVEDSP